LTKEPNKDKGTKNRGTLRGLANFSQIGVTMASSVFVGVMLGKYLDGFLGTSPWLLLIFSLLGVGAAIRVLFNISKDQKDEK
jgi:ATP synthase protein I